MFCREHHVGKQSSVLFFCYQTVLSCKYTKDAWRIELFEIGPNVGNVCEFAKDCFKQRWVAAKDVRNLTILTKHPKHIMEIETSFLFLLSWADGACIDCKYDPSQDHAKPDDS